MKKLIAVLALALFVVGCSKNDDREMLKEPEAKVINHVNDVPIDDEIRVNLD